MIAFPAYSSNVFSFLLWYTIIAEMGFTQSAIEIQISLWWGTRRSFVWSNRWIFVIMTVCVSLKFYSYVDVSNSSFSISCTLCQSVWVFPSQSKSPSSLSLMQGSPLILDRHLIALSDFAFHHLLDGVNPNSRYVIWQDKSWHKLFN